MLARDVDPLGPITSSAEGEPGCILAHPVTLLDPTWRIHFPWERSLPINLTTKLLLESQKLVRFLGQSTILYGDQGPEQVIFFLSATPPNHKSL